MRRSTKSSCSKVLFALLSAGPFCNRTFGDVGATWSGGNGSWNIASEWSGHVVPNNSGSTYYDVLIDGQPSVVSSVTVGTAAPKSVTVTELQVDAGDSVAINSGGTLAVAGTLNDSGNLTANTGGTLTVATWTTQGTGEITSDGGYVSITQPYSISTATPQFSIAGGGQLFFGTLNNGNSTTLVTGGTLGVQTLTNAAGTVGAGSGGTFTVANPYTRVSTNDISLAAGGSVSFGTLNEAGFSFSVPNGSTFSAQTLNNSNSVFNSSGISTISSLVNTSGRINLGNGAQVASGNWNNNGGTTTLSAGASLNVSNGTLTGGIFSVDPAASLNVIETNANFSSFGNFTLNSGTLTIGPTGIYNNNLLPGTIQNNGNLNWGGGGAIGNGAVILGGTGICKFSATVDAYLGSFENDSTIQGSGSICRTFGGGINDTATNNGIIEATTPASGTSQFTFGGTTSLNANDGQLIVDAQATMILNSTHFSSTGAITVNNGGILSFGNGDSPPASDTVSKILNNGQIVLNSANLTVNTITGGGDVQAEYNKFVVSNISCGSLEVIFDYTAQIASQPAGSPILADSVGLLTVNYGALRIMPAVSKSSRIVLVTTGFTLNGTLDLSNNDMDIRTGSLTQISTAVMSGYNGGSWNGSTGIISSSAAADTTHLTTLGVIQNSLDQNGGPSLLTAFDNQPVTDTDILVKFTYYGDANLDGKVDGSDYSRIDAAYLADKGNHTALTGWYNGDFNYDGVVNGSDYTLIDNAFNTQGASLASAVANPIVQITDEVVSGTAAVPESATIGMLALCIAGLLGQRRCF